MRFIGRVLGRWLLVMAAIGGIIGLATLLAYGDYTLALWVYSLWGAEAAIVAGVGALAAFMALVFIAGDEMLS